MEVMTIKKDGDGNNDNKNKGNDEGGEAISDEAMKDVNHQSADQILRGINDKRNESVSDMLWNIFKDYW